LSVEYQFAVTNNSL